MHIKKWITSFFLLILLVSISSYGEEGLTESNPIRKSNPHHIYLGPEFFLFNLNTHVQDVKVDGWKFFGGLRLRYEYLRPKAFYAGIDLFSAVGRKSFDASYHRYHFHQNNANTGFGNLELRFGYTFLVTPGTLTPFLGIGAYSFSNYGHNFHFHEDMFYYAAGIRSLFELSPLFSLGVNWKVFRTSDTEKEFKFKLAYGRHVKLTDHNDMWGGEIGVPFVWYVGSKRRWEIQLEPYFLKLDFTEVQNIYGTRLLFGYRF